MGRKKRGSSPSEDEEWSDVLSAGQMDTLMEAQRCVDTAHTVRDIQTGVTGASDLLKHLIPPGCFVQLVAEQQQGGPSSASPPPPNCSLRQMLRWKHSSSNAVAVVAKAVLQGKVPQLEAAIEQRRARDAQIAEAEKKLTAMMEMFRQEMQGLRNPGSSGQQSDRDGGHEPFSTDGLGNQLATAAVNLAQGAAAAAAEDGRGAAPGTAAAKKRPGPVVTSAAAGAATATATGTPPVVRVKAQAGKPDAADAPRSRQLQGCPWVFIPGDRSRLAQQAADAAAEAYEEELGRSSRLEAAEAAAAAREEQQLSADIAARGGVVLPPEGHKALSNSHRIFKGRMRVTAYMTPDNVDDKVAGVKELLDDQLLRFLDDHQVILMSYKLLECETQKTFLHPEPPPMLTVEALADVVTFEPTPGDIVCGVVRKLSHTSITLLLLGCISVAIERPFIPEDWEYDLHSHCWVPGGDYNKAVSKGDLMNCVLLSYPQQDPEQEEVLFNLEGSLLTPHTGLRDWQWPRQQRVRQLLAAQHGQREAYSPGDEAHWQSLHKQLRQAKLTRRKLIPIDEVGQAGGEDSDDADLEQQQQQQTQQQQQDQQQQQQGQSSKDAKQAQKEAAKQAKQEAKARAKADKQAAKAAEKAARKEARRAEKTAAKAEKKRARDQQQQGVAAAATAEQPAAKKQKLVKVEQQPQQANGHAADAQQQRGKHKGDKSEKRKKQTNG